MAGRILTVGRDLLVACAAALPSPPERQIFTIGNPTEPLERDQLAVGFIRTIHGVPGAEDPGPQYEFSERSLEYVVHLNRCFDSSTGRADTPVSVIDAAVAALADETDLLVTALIGWHPPSAHTTSGRGTAEERWVGQVQGVRPSGKTHAVSITVQVSR